MGTSLWIQKFMITMVGIITAHWQPCHWSRELTWSVSCRQLERETNRPKSVRWVLISIHTGHTWDHLAAHVWNLLLSQLVLGVGFSYFHRPLLICSGDSSGDTGSSSTGWDSWNKVGVDEGEGLTQVSINISCVFWDYLVI